MVHSRALGYLASSQLLVAGGSGRMGSGVASCHEVAFKLPLSPGSLNPTGITGVQETSACARERRLRDS